MATATDHQLGLKQETTWNTPVVVDRFFEWLPGSGIDWDPNVVQGEGLRAGSQVERSGRRVPLVGRGSGKLKIELASRGFGTLLQGCFGTAVSTVVSGATYQQLFTALISGTYLPAFTVQEGIVLPGGTVHAYTYAGCTISKWTLECSATGLATLEVEVDARSLATGTALATASYPTTPTLFSGALPLTGAMAVGGTLTAPLAIVLGSIAGGTANVAVKSWKLEVDNNIDTKRDVIGGRNQPVVGQRKIKLSTLVEYDATTGATFRDAQIGQTVMPVLLTSNAAEALSVGTATFQLACPAAFIDGGAIPQPTDGSTVTTSISWSVLDNLTQSPLYGVLRTADAAL